MLTTEQLGFFARNGFLHLPAHIDADACARLVEDTWSLLPADWDRDDPDTWTWAAPVTDSCHTADLTARRGHLKFQRHELPDLKLISRTFGPGSKAAGLAEALFGTSEIAMKLRGLYPIVPMPEGISYKKPMRPHIEAHPSQLIAMHYLEDVEPGGGGLSVWPGSHREIYPLLGSKLEHVSTPEYEACFEKWAGREPIEVAGGRGDVVIIHHRLLHAPSLNRSRRIRFGFLCDYQGGDFARQAAERPSENLWEDWPAIAAVPPDLRDGPCDYTLVGRAASGGKPHGLSSVRGAGNANLHPTMQRKAEASVLARARHAGDTWIQISDNPDILNDLQVQPLGGPLASQGLGVSVDGSSRESESHFDFVVRLPEDRAATDPAASSLWRRLAGNLGFGKPGGHGPNRHDIVLSGNDKPLWIKAVRIELPFQNSKVLLSRRIEPGERRIAFDVPQPEPAPAPAPA